MSKRAADSPPARDLPKLSSLRLPPELAAWVRGEAERNRASIASEVVRALRERMERLTRNASN